MVAGIVGKSQPLADLRLATAAITQRYRDDGYFLARAYIPPQEMKDGVLVIAVSEGKLADVKVENTSRVSDAGVRDYLAALSLGAPVSRGPMDRVTYLLQDVPGIGRADARFAQGPSTGTTSLVVQTTPAPLATGRVDVDNHGSQYTGRYRVTASGELNSPFGWGERFSGRLTRSDKNLISGRLAAQMPLGANGWTLLGSVSHTQYALGDAFANLDAVGQSTAADLGLRYPIIRGPNANLYLQGGVERRNLVDELRAFSVRTEKHAELGTASLSGDWRDSLGGGGAMQASLGVSTGRLTIDSATAAATDAVAAQTQGAYSKVSLSVDRQQALFGPFSLGLSWRGQYASKNLDTSEKFSLGGAYGVRAYPGGEGSGDQGWVASADLRYQVNDSLMASVFADAGGVKVNAKPFLTTPNARELSGLGVGLAGSVPSSVGKFEWRITAAWRTSSTPVSETDRSPRVWAQAGLRF